MIKVQNIYYMLAYAYQALSIYGINAYSTEKFEYVDDLFAAILAKGISMQIKKGIQREYTLIQEEVSSPKGKIIQADTFRQEASQRKLVICEHDDYSENNRLNQILKLTMNYLICSSDVSKENKKSLKRVMFYFARVEDIHVKDIEWKRLAINRNNKSYRLLLNICYLVLESMLVTEKDGTTRLNRFIDDQRMSSLYEHFVLEFFKKHYAHIKVTQSHIPWNTDDDVVTLLPQMKSDIMLEHQGKTLIIDTKYYSSSLQKHSQFNSETIHSHNLYQIFAYVKNKDIHSDGSVSGLLLYANTDGNNPDISYKLGGNTIGVTTLDLNTDFTNIKMKLCSIVDGWIQTFE